MPRVSQHLIRETTLAHFDELSHVLTLATEGDSKLLAKPVMCDQHAPESVAGCPACDAIRRNSQNRAGSSAACVMIEMRVAQPHQPELSGRQYQMEQQM